MRKLTAAGLVTAGSSEETVGAENGGGPLISVAQSLNLLTSAAPVGGENNFLLFVVAIIFTTVLVLVATSSAYTRLGQHKGTNDGLEKDNDKKEADHQFPLLEAPLVQAEA